MSGRFTVEIALPPAEANDAVGEMARAWDGEWSPGVAGGRLRLPVVYGLRHGEAKGRIEIERLGDGRSRLTWSEEGSRLVVHKRSVAILSIAAVPVVGSIAWPFWPILFPLVPFAAIFGLIAWWLVISRLRSTGPEEFLQEVAVQQDANDSNLD